MGYPNRRTFIKSAFAGVGWSFLSPRLSAQTAAGTIEATKLSDNLSLYTGAGANVLAMTGPDGVVMVDGGLEEHSAPLLKAVGGRIHTLFNTHWHPEHTGSNLAVGKAGGTILAHENTRLWLSTDITRPWETKTFPPLPKEARPNKTFYTTGSLSVNGEQIDYGYMLQAHTDGDIYVYFRKSNVLALGGLTSANGWPLIDWWTGGWIEGLANGLDTAAKVANPETRIVTANGPIMTHAELQAHAKMYRTVSQRVQQLMRRGRGVQETLDAAPTKEFDAQMGNAEQFVRRAVESCWAHLTPDASRD